jgi:hypothetical protein
VTPQEVSVLPTIDDILLAYSPSNHGPIERPLDVLFATSHQSIDDAVRHAVQAIVASTEAGEPVESLVALLVDPWWALRRTDADACVLRDAVGTDLRWIALRGLRADMAERARLFRRFAAKLHPDAALVAFMEDGALVVVVQRRGHADFVARAAVKRGPKGRIEVGAPENELRDDLETIAVFPVASQVAQAAIWPVTPF